MDNFSLFTATASHDLVSNSVSIDASSMSIDSSQSTTTSDGFASVSGLTDCDSVGTNLELVEGNRTGESHADTINENVSIQDANINLNANENASNYREVLPFRIMLPTQLSMKVP